MNFLGRCKALVAEYVALLVPDWKIEVEVFDGRRDGSVIEGECYPSWEYKGGLLRFHDIEAYPTGRKFDLDSVVAHEVGHCVLAVMCTESGTWQRRAEEWVVETFARAMVGLRRGLRAAPAELAAEMRHLMKSTVVRRRMAGGRRRRMVDPESAKLILDIGGMLATEEVSAEFRAKIEALVAMATGGDVEDVGDGATDPEATVMSADPAAPDPNAPAFKRSLAALEAKLKADMTAPDAAIASEKRATLIAERRSRVAAEETARLREDTLRVALFDAKPGIFSAAVRAKLAAAPVDEVRRFGEAAAELRAATPAPEGRQRRAPGEPREPPPGGEKGGPRMVNGIVVQSGEGMFREET